MGKEGLLVFCIKESNIFESLDDWQEKSLFLMEEMCQVLDEGCLQLRPGVNSTGY
jgi:hypothetical protein